MCLLKNLEGQKFIKFAVVQPRQTLLSAASRVGEASDRVLYTIGEEDVTDRERKDLVLGLAKTVANSTAALVLKAKNVASECDNYNQTRVRPTIKDNIYIL